MLCAEDALLENDARFRAIWTSSKKRINFISVRSLFKHGLQQHKQIYIFLIHSLGSFTFFLSLLRDSYSATTFFLRIHYLLRILLKRYDNSQHNAIWSNQQFYIQHPSALHFIACQHTHINDAQTIFPETCFSRHSNHNMHSDPCDFTERLCGPRIHFCTIFLSYDFHITSSILQQQKKKKEIWCALWVLCMDYIRVVSVVLKQSKQRVKYKL